MKKLFKKILGPYLISKVRTKKAYDIGRRRIFYSSFVRKNELCFDIGANIGNRITPLLALGAKIVAVEPQEICHAYLKKKFGNKIEIITKGLGDSEGSKEFHLSNTPTLSSFSEEWINSVKEARFKDITWNRVVLVEMTTLDKLIEQYGIPTFIKIDVEGYELAVLQGLTNPVKMISFEYTVPEQAGRPAMCIEQIEKSNPNIECNYSIGESMEFAKNEWLPSEEMKKHMLSDEFTNTIFGDVYVRTR